MALWYEFIKNLNIALRVTTQLECCRDYLAGVVIIYLLLVCYVIQLANIDLKIYNGFFQFTFPFERKPRDSFTIYCQVTEVHKLNYLFMLMRV